MTRIAVALAVSALAFLPSARASAQRGAANAADSINYKYSSTPQLDALKAEAAKEIDAKAKMIQEMVDQVFSFGELGMQEVETSKYLTGILEQNGFKVERGGSGIPTAFVAKWGSGKPVISLGSDIDGIPQAGNKPGVGYKDTFIQGSPGHGEGHNSGMPLNVAAAIVVKKIMERDRSRARSCSGPVWPRSRCRARRGSCGPACSRTWTSRCSRTS